ncbi:hypothetical protein [Microscilla marina]|uniref:Uncharacterized protein n=1 Tax=Microscilla marina ATCC 23134 TaxID=313606 RepID=A1ZPT7_MICM2|nr:hypothetical protein [Microscilla marina]EAY27592.1 hypothetical protein M23134_02839 [Microscilla marina ATCC 23134]
MIQKINFDKLKKLLSSEDEANKLIAFEIIQSSGMEIPEGLTCYLVESADICIKYGSPFIDVISGSDACGGLSYLVKVINKRNIEKKSYQSIAEEANNKNDRIVEKCIDYIRGHTDDEIKAMILREMKNIIEL